MTTELSTYVDYEVKEKPADIKLVEGEWYELYNGGYQKVQIVKLRVIEDKVAVYYRKLRKVSSFGLVKDWIYDCAPLDVFKAGIMDLGSVQSIDLKGSKPEGK